MRTLLAFSSMLFNLDFRISSFLYCSTIAFCNSISISPFGFAGNLTGILEICTMSNFPLFDSAVLYLYVI